MPKCADDGVRSGEREPARDNADGVHGIPVATASILSKNLERRRKVGVVSAIPLPYPEKLDVYVDREGLFKGVRLSPSEFVWAFVHLVCERDLLVIAGRK